MTGRLLTLLLVTLTLTACSPDQRELRALVGESTGCTCTCADASLATPDVAPDATVVASPDATVDASPDAAVDASVDASPDASPDAADDASPDAPPPSTTTPWMRTILVAGAPSPSLMRGADGTKFDPEGCVITGWEEGNRWTRKCPGVPAEVQPISNSALEDAAGADFDLDGVIDVVACGADRCTITFRGSSNTVVPITSTFGRGNAIQVAIVDANSDGLPDLIVGTRAGSASNPAEIGLYENPGALARTGAWAHHTISAAGWIMSIVPVGGRLVVSDRSYHFGPTGTHLWDLYGSRWLEQTSPGVWVNHTIAGGVCPIPASQGGCPQINEPAGACPAGQPLCTTRLPGDEMFLAVDGDTVYDCQSTNASIDSRIMIHRTTDWLTWTHEVLPPVANVGHCQGVIPVVNHDGLTDLIVTTWKGNVFPVPEPAASESGAYLLHALPDGRYERVEISGPNGGKFDNAIMDGPSCFITSEQLDPAGGLGVVEYCAP